MKKILVCLILSLISATSSFAATTYSVDFSAGKTGLTLYGDKTTAATTTALIAKTSTGVGLGILVLANGSQYALVTQHKSGSKVFGTAFSSTSIKSMDVTTVGAVYFAVPTVTDDSDFANWTTQ